MLYDYNYGLFNTLLKLVGLDSAVKPWLSDTKLALALVSFPLIWKNIGYYLIILLSGLASIDSSILEMAEIDGANATQRLWYIVLPMLRNTLVVCLTLCISGNMKVFDHIYVMTGGGPGTATMVMALYAYENSFVRYKMGYGSTLSIGILILSVSLTLVVRKLTVSKMEA
jgi:raffinose/stachyose/melibiose transport system permease protein